MVAINTIKTGDVLYDCHKVRMGNTTMKRMACYTVRIIEIDHEKGIALVSWNGNSPTKFYPARLQKLRRTPIKEK